VKQLYCQTVLEQKYMILIS